MLMCKDLLIPRTQVALLVVCTSHMSVQIRPTKTGNIATRIRTIVSEEQQRIFNNLRVLILNTDILICAD